MIMKCLSDLFDAEFKDFLDGRMEDYENEICGREEFLVIHDKIEKIYNEMNNLIPEEKRAEFRKLWLDLDGFQTEEVGLHDEYLFHYGVEEGARLILGILRAVSLLGGT